METLGHTQIFCPRKGKAANDPPSQLSVLSSFFCSISWQSPTPPPRKRWGNALLTNICMSLVYSDMASVLVCGQSRMQASTCTCSGSPLQEALLGRAIRMILPGSTRSRSTCTYRRYMYQYQKNPSGFYPYLELCPMLGSFTDIIVPSPLDRKLTIISITVNAINLDSVRVSSIL